MKEFHLNIADINILVKTQDPILTLEIDANHEQFISTKPAIDDPDYEVEVIKKIPLEYRESKTIFDSKIILNNQEFIWKAIQLNNLSCVLLFYNHSIERPSYALKIDESKKWTIYTDIISEDNSINPFQYPLGTILLYYILLKNNGFILHGSGTFDGAKGRIFTGVSGRGKSTISQLWKDSGALRIQDDRLIIRNIEGTYFMYNSPMLVPEVSQKAPIDEIFFIYHAKQNESKRLSAGDGFKQLLPNCVQHHFNEEFIRLFIQSVNDFSGKVKFFDLGFVPNDSVVAYIKEMQ